MVSLGSSLVLHLINCTYHCGGGEPVDFPDCQVGGGDGEVVGGGRLPVERAGRADHPVPGADCEAPLRVPARDTVLNCTVHS